MNLRQHITPDSENAAFDSGLNILFLAAFPLVLWLFQGSAVGVSIALFSIALFSLALRVISAGQKQQQAYDAAEVAHAPRLPRKLIGSLMIGLVALILAANHFVAPQIPLAIGAVAAGLSLVAFGMDPMRDKGVDNPEVLARMEAEAFLLDTEDRLIELGERVARLGDANMTLRTDTARDLAMRLVRTFASDPQDLPRFRKPVSKFVEILQTEIDRLEAAWGSEDSAFAQKRYAAKLQVLSESFEERVRLGGVKSGKDAFDMEADLLLDRMPQESAA